MDAVLAYSSALNLAIKPKTVLVEGTTDVELFELAAKLERRETGIELLGEDVGVVAAGMGELGGTNGVIRELICLRGLSRTCLLPNGNQRYRFVGLFDNDKAGRLAIKAARDFDNSILEYKDVFRLCPVMPIPKSRDLSTVQKAFAAHYERHKGLDWELEDMLPADLFDAFLSEFPTAVTRSVTVEAKTHRDLTRDGKARLHRFTKQNALRRDLVEVVEALRAMRFYLAAT